MNPEQALQILNNLANLCATNGGIYGSVNEAAAVSVAIKTLNDMAVDYTTVSEKLDKMLAAQKPTAKLTTKSA